MLGLQTVACGAQHEPSYVRATAGGAHAAPASAPKDVSAPGMADRAAQPAPEAPPAGAPPVPKRELGALDRKVDDKPRAEDKATRQPLLVYVGTYDLEVADVVVGLADVEAVAKAVGGFLAKREDRSITIRVPVASFSDAEGRVGKLGTLLHREVSAEDVTDEVADVESRLKNARAMRDRMEHLLQKAANIPDAIAIEKELARISQDIERLEGRSKLLRDRAAFSTLTVRLSPRKVDAPIVANVPPPPPPAKRPKLKTPWLSELGLSHLQTF